MRERGLRGCQKADQPTKQCSRARETSSPSCSLPRYMGILGQGHLPAVHGTIPTLAACPEQAPREIWESGDVGLRLISATHWWHKLPLYLILHLSFTYEVGMVTTVSFLVTKKQGPRWKVLCMHE